MSREDRIGLIKGIEEKRGSKVIAYITSDRQNLSAQIAGDVIPLIHRHILAFPDGSKKKLDFFIYSRGGNSDVPWGIVSMFREYCEQGSFSVLIPFRAHSAATVISLGADEIVMGRKGELGPIDITMASGPYNPTDSDKSRLPISVEDVNGYFQLLEKIGCERPEEKLAAFQHLAREVHPLALGKVSRLLQQTELVTLKLLSTRAVPFAEERNREIARRLSSEIYSHSHTISRSEAKKDLALEQVTFAEDVGIDGEMWKLYESYRDMFQFEAPFLPEQHLVENDLDENTWSDQPVACVESSESCDICAQSIRVRRLRQVPPQVTVTIKDVALPPINLPVVSVDTSAIVNAVQQVVKTEMSAVIQAAAEEAARALLKGLPFAGFERTIISGGWRKEG